MLNSKRWTYGCLHLFSVLAQVFEYKNLWLLTVVLSAYTSFDKLMGALKIQKFSVLTQILEHNCQILMPRTN